VLSSSQVISYAVVSGVVIAIPGPSVLFAVGRALSGGRRSALASVVGNALGVYVVAVLVSIGLGAVVARSDVAFDVIKYVGSAYLVYLGARAIANRRKLTTALTAQQPAWGAARSARQGFVVGVANPKALLLFGAVLPQFVDRAAGDVPLQMLLLALVSFFTALLSDSAWVLAASAFRRWFARSPRRLELIGGAGGLAVVVVGITVALTGRRD
jgi:threonine/homoserine/homoserine lactone efflux protein